MSSFTESVFVHIKISVCFHLHYANVLKCMCELRHNLNLKSSICCNGVSGIQSSYICDTKDSFDI